jgi:Uma2 family endonuclease
MITTKNKKKSRPSRRKQVPEELVYETMADGTPIYYRDYEQYLKGTKTAEALIGSIYLQGYIISKVLRYLFKILPDTYELMTNELGLQYTKHGWRASDIVIYEKEKLKTIPLNNKYMPIPPKIIFEIDTKASFDQFNTPMDYFNQKTDDLLNFGVEKVIWIFTSTKKVMVAEKNQHWIITDWNLEIPVLETVGLNIERILQENESK